MKVLKNLLHEEEESKKNRKAKLKNIKNRVHELEKELKK